VNGLSSHGIRWPDIAARNVARQPAGGRCGGPINAIAPAIRADANVANSPADGAPAPSSGTPKNQPAKTRARAIIRPRPVKNFAARGRAATNVSPEVAVHRCKASVVSHAVELYGVCSSGNRAGYSTGLGRAIRSVDGGFGQILKPPILRLSFVAV